jgi:transcription initiation factor IIF auxiliary subunit
VFVSLKRVISSFLSPMSSKNSHSDLKKSVSNLSKSKSRADLPKSNSTKSFSIKDVSGSRSRFDLSNSAHSKAELSKSQSRLELSTPESNPNSAINAKNTEIIYKMSKKIAQLTKVIYFLNTKNEDGTLKIKILQEDFDDELKDTVEEGATVISMILIYIGELQTNLQEEELKSESLQKQLDVFFIIDL